METKKPIEGRVVSNIINTGSRGLDTAVSISTEPTTWDMSTIAAMKSLGARVQSMQLDVKETVFNAEKGQSWPTAYIDAMLVARGDILEAPVPLSYLEGFPVVDGLPLWERLENEAINFYNLFKAYRDMKDVDGKRDIKILCERSRVKPATIICLMELFHWQLRLRAYDLFRELEKARKREAELQEVLGSHKRVAVSLRERAMKILEDQDMLSPKLALEALKLSIEVERLSVGLERNKAEGTNQTAPSTINITNQLLQTAPKGGGGNGPGSGSDPDALDKILSVLEASGAIAYHPRYSLGETEPSKD